MNKIVLTVTHHDPEGRVNNLAVSALPTLSDFFEGIVVVTTPVTPAMTDLPSNVLWVRDTVSSVGENYSTAIRRGFESDADIIFYVDFDRIIHWIECYPSELAALLADVRGMDMKHKHIVCERTPHAYESHHEALFETEKEPNQIISETIGLQEVHDFLAGAAFYSKESAKVVLDYGPGKEFSLYGSWPVAIARAGVELLFRQCDGLSWETPDRYQKEVEEAGGLAAWRQAHSSAHEWERRTAMAKSFICEL